MATERSEELFRQFTEQRRQDTRQQALSQQLGGASEAIVDFFVQKEQRADETAKNKLARRQRLEDLVSEAELKDELAVLKNRRTIDKEATANRRTDVRNLELDAVNIKKFNAAREKEKIEQGFEQQRIDIQKKKASKAAKAKAPTQGQFRAELFVSRLKLANPTINDSTKKRKDPETGKDLLVSTTLTFSAARALPEGIKPQEVKELENAEVNFVTAVLRPESGAAISATEFKDAAKVYFPAIGDGPKVLAQKAAARALVIRALQAEADGILPPRLINPTSVSQAVQELEARVKGLDSQGPAPQGLQQQGGLPTLQAPQFTAKDEKRRQELLALGD